MNKQKGILIFLSAALIILELLPYGVVYTPEAAAAAYSETCSYFSPVPFGYANFVPLTIALLSCALLCLVLIYALKNKTLTAIKVISMIIVVLSFYPVIMGLSYFSAVGIAVAAVAFAEAVWSFVTGQTAK